MTHTMSKSKLVGAVWVGMFRMKSGGRWHTVAHTDGSVIEFRTAEDAEHSAENVGRMYRTGATQ